MYLDDDPYGRGKKALVAYGNFSPSAAPHCTSAAKIPLSEGTGSPLYPAPSDLRYDREKKLSTPILSIDFSMPHGILITVDNYARLRPGRCPQMVIRVSPPFFSALLWRLRLRGVSLALGNGLVQP